MLHFILIILTEGMPWCHWWCFWHHVTLISVSMASNYQRVLLLLISTYLTKEMQCYLDNYMIPGLASVVSQDERRYVAPHFDHLDLRNALVPLPVLTQRWCHHMTETPMTMALFASNIDVISITWQKCHVVVHLNCLNIWNTMVPLVMLLAWCNTDGSPRGIRWPKTMLHLISNALSKECNCAIYDAMSIIW